MSRRCSSFSSSAAFSPSHSRKTGSPPDTPSGSLHNCVMTIPQAVVVGTSFGGRIHVPALRAAGIGVHALVGRDLARTRARADALEVPNAHTSLADALADGVATCVTIATPPDVRSGPVLEAL